MYTPGEGNSPRYTATEFPDGDISFLDGIEPMGNKFHGADSTGPEGQLNTANGDYVHTLYFNFD